MKALTTQTSPQQRKGKRMSRIVLVVVSLLLLAGSSMAQDLFGERTLDIDLDGTFVSKYLWRGYDTLDDHGAFQPSINLDLFQSGFSVNVWGSFALSKGFEDVDELDYALAYGYTFFEEEPYAIDLSAAFIYYDFPNTTSDLADTLEAGVALAMPNLLELGPRYLVPSWYSGYLWPKDDDLGPEEGWHHIFGLAYDIPISPLLSNQEEQAISLAADVTYNDGTFDSDSGISHATFGVSTSFEVGPLSITPSATYQWSFEDSVNDEDEFWSGISLTYSFSAF